MQAMGKNSSTTEGAQALTAALDQHKDADVNDIPGFLKKIDTNDGAKIVQHVLGDENEQVQKNLAKKTGMDASQVSSILTMLAPLVMGYLGQQKKEQNLDANGVSGLITNTLGQSSNSGMMTMSGICWANSSRKKNEKKCCFSTNRLVLKQHFLFFVCSFEKLYNLFVRNLGELHVIHSHCAKIGHRYVQAYKAVYHFAYNLGSICRRHRNCND
jgi:hypothetical protein